VTCSFDLEDRLLHQNYSHICGIDEVGRGCLFGPVVAGAVILDPAKINSDIKDSKKVNPVKREELASDIYINALSFGIGWCWNDRIDDLNIVDATKISMAMAVKNLHIPPDYVLMDAMDPGFLDVKGEGIIKGDAKSFSIASASIIAKVFRDNLMRQFGKFFKGYNLESNKGYPTRDHIFSLSTLGRTTFHRKSFQIKNG